MCVHTLSELSSNLYLYVCRRCAEHETQDGHLLRYPRGDFSFSDNLWLYGLRLHPLPLPSKTEKAAGHPTGRRHQQSEGNREPHQKCGPSCAPPAPRRPDHALSSPCPCTLPRRDWTDPPIISSTFTLFSSTETCTRTQTGHFKPGEREIEPLPLHREPGSGGLTLEPLGLWGAFLKKCS